MKSNLDNLIPPEISNDRLYYLIQDMVREEKPLNVQEIGSSSGAGSTQAFVQSMRAHSPQSVLYCLEISKNRFLKLQKA